jgi:hypothetical protein
VGERLVALTDVANDLKPDQRLGPADQRGRKDAIVTTVVIDDTRPVDRWRIHHWAPGRR